MTDSDLRQQNLEGVKRAFAAIGKGDADAMMANYTDDVQMELPFGSPPFVMNGRDKITAYLREAFKTFKFELTLTEVHECLDPNRLVVEFTSDGMIATTGKKYANRYIAVYWFRDGKVCKWREFLNPTIMAEAFAQ